MLAEKLDVESKGEYIITNLFLLTKCRKLCLIFSGKYVVSVKQQHVIFSGLRGSSWFREQFPLRLAYASTVHKVQGLTLKSVVLYFSDWFLFGIVYVGMSRVCSLDNLSFGALNWEKLEKSLVADPMSTIHEFYHMLAAQNMKALVSRLLGLEDVDTIIESSVEVMVCCRSFVLRYFSCSLRLL